MSEPVFGHEKLHVYQAGIEFSTFAARLVSRMRGNARNARDQLIRSSQSIPLNIAEGNGKRSVPDRKRFFEIARGSALEGAATLDVLAGMGAIGADDVATGKAPLVRIVAMLTRMTEPDDSAAREDGAEYSTSEESARGAIGEYGDTARSG